MKLFDTFFGSHKKEAKLLEKPSRAVAIVTAYTAPDEDMLAAIPPQFGLVVFKYRRNDKWVVHKVILREDIGEIAEGQQWIVKFDENYTRIIAVHTPLSPNSPYRIEDDEADEAANVAE